MRIIASREIREHHLLGEVIHQYTLSEESGVFYVRSIKIRGNHTKELFSKPYRTLDDAHKHYADLIDDASRHNYNHR